MADAVQKSFYNSFAVVVTSTGLTAVGFGFPANRVRLIVDSGGPAYLSLKSTVAADATTGGGYPQTSGDSALDVSSVGGLSGLAICTTSTALSMRLGAWGG